MTDTFFCFSCGRHRPVAGQQIADGRRPACATCAANLNRRMNPDAIARRSGSFDRITNGQAATARHNNAKKKYVNGNFARFMKDR